MASTVTRRPLPALIALLALLLLTALVWWRVLNRGSGATPHAAATSCTTSSASPAARLPAPGSVSVEVLNATTHSGIAAKARTALITGGFSVPNAAKNDSSKRLNKIKYTAQIRYGPAARTGATLLRYYFPGSVLLATKSTSKTVVVSLGNKYTRVAPPTVVRAAMKKANVVAGTPSPAASC